MAMKVATESVRVLRYKIKMMEIPIRGSCYVFGDNKSDIHNSSVPDSVLKKKSNSIAYNHIQEGKARYEWRITYIDTDKNHSDMMTKILPYGEKRIKFCRTVLQHIYEYGKHMTRRLNGR